MNPLRIEKLAHVLKNTAAQLSVKAITSSTTLLTTILISYYLGLSSFGSFTKILTFVSFYYLIVDFGLNAQFLKHHFDKTHENIGKLLVLRFLISCILMAAAILIALLLPYNAATGTGFSATEKLGIILFSTTILTFGLQLSFQSLLQRALTYHYLIRPNVIASIVLLAGIAWGVFQHNLVVVILAYVVSNVVLCFSLYYIVKRKLGAHLQLHNFRTFAKQLLFASWPIGLILFFNLIYSKADAFMLALYKPSFDVGVYGLAYRFFEFMIAIPAFVANSLYPIMLAHAHSEEKLYAITKKYSILLLGASFIMTIVVLIAAPLLQVLKPDYELAVAPLRILALALPFFFITGLIQWLFIIKDHKFVLIGIYAFSLLLNVVLNLWAIPRYSYNGAAITTVVSEGFVLAALIGYSMVIKKRRV